MFSPNGRTKLVSLPLFVRNWSLRGQHHTLSLYAGLIVWLLSFQHRNCNYIEEIFSCHEGFFVTLTSEMSIWKYVIYREFKMIIASPRLFLHTHQVPQRKQSNEIILKTQEELQRCVVNWSYIEVVLVVLKMLMTTCSAERLARIALKRIQSCWR